MSYTASTDHHNTPAQPQTAQTSSSQRRHLALQRRPGRRVPPDGAFWAAEATSRSRTSAHQPPCGRPSPGSQPPAAAAGFSNVANAPAACRSTAPARPVVQQPLLEQQVTLCRLAAAGCETLGRRRLHRVVPSNHATSGSRGPWQVEPWPHAEGAATGPHRARPRACRVYVFVHEDKTKPKKR